MRPYIRGRGRALAPARGAVGLGVRGRWQHDGQTAALTTPARRTTITIRTRLLGGLTGTLLTGTLMTTPAVAGPVPGVVLPAADTTTKRVTRIVDGDTIATTQGTIRLV